MTTAQAQLIISEIFYDPPGSDANREWIEVFNTSSQSVDLLQWKFRENNVNHGLHHHSGPSLLLPGEYAVIADNAAFVKTEWNLGEETVLYDSVFSLNNTGEPLSLITPDGNEISIVSYNSQWGANGDGNSLNLIDGDWVPRAPSPGKAPTTEVIQPPPTSGSSSSGSKQVTIMQPASLTDTSAADGPELDLTYPLSVAAGEKAEFSGQVDNSRLGFIWEWHLGDGVIKDVSDFTHYYDLPGRYSASVKVGTRREPEMWYQEFLVEVVPYNIAVVIDNYRNQNFVRLSNNSGATIDVSNWKIMVGTVNYALPANLRLVSNGTYQLSLESEAVYPIQVFDSAGRFVIDSNPISTATSSNLPSISSDPDENTFSSNLGMTDFEQEQLELRAELEAYLQTQERGGSTVIGQDLLERADALLAASGVLTERSEVSPVANSSGYLNLIAAGLLGAVAVFIFSRPSEKRLLTNLANNDEDNEQDVTQGAKEYKIIDISDDDDKNF